MPSFKHILFPIDFSPQTCSIAPHVACMAKRSGARVTMLHVAELPAAAYPGFPLEAMAIDFQEMLQDRKDRVDSFLRTEFENVAATRLMLEGDPAFVIADYAAKERVDLIMMPTHGYGPFRRFILGSVTAKVLHDVKCPVWTSAHVPEAPAGSAGYRNLLCAVDLTPKSLPLLRWSCGFARELGATLKLVHAVPAEVRLGVDMEGEDWRAFLFDMARAEIAKLQQEAGTRFELILAGGNVEHVVRGAAEESHADLVVVGRGVMQEKLGRMRTHVYSIIREAPCPVMSV
jgi:nucleotide-binding universal stress UspA family protein